MKQKEVMLSEEDKKLMASYSQMLEGMSAYLGKGYEIVLHSLEDFEHSAIKVLNGEHTGRKEGAPITELALDMLKRINEDGEGDHICYNSTNAKGEPLYSTTIAIRGSKNKVIGLLCINFYMNTSIFDFYSQLFSEKNLPVIKEHYIQDSEELLDNIIEQAVAEIEQLNIGVSQQKREIILRLYKKGVFSMKGAVPHVAEKLNISINTVYLHLRTIKEN